MEVGRLTQCLWTCYRIKKWCGDILQELYKIFGTDVGVDPLCLLLGLPNNYISDKFKKKLCNVLTFCARKCILLQWITDKIPSIASWHRVVLEHVSLDYLTHLLRSKTNVFYDIQEHFLLYIGSDLSSILVRALV